MSSIESKTTEKVNTVTYSDEMENAVGYNNWIVDTFKPYLHGDVLEIGVGHGTFKQYFDCLSYTGLDIDEKLIAHAKKSNPDAQYLHLDLADPTLMQKVPEKYDAILCFNVLEHIENDSQAVENMLQMLKPSGHLLLFVPAFMFLYNDLDALVGHYRRYTKKPLIRLIQNAKGKVISAEYFNSIGGLGWFLNKFIKHQDINSTQVNSQIKFFEKWVLPFSKTLNILTKHFFGQSLLCVVQKS